tara:strand:- start:25 stop:276 length:252 start_codon:yes stop_codon:yes gene_type:complete
MSIFKRKIFACNHPLDSIEPKGCVEVTLKPNGTHNLNKITFVCTKCNTVHERSWDTMTPKFRAELLSHTAEIEAALFFKAFKL